MCGPRGLPTAKNILYHNLGGGKFEDVTKKVGIEPRNQPAGLTFIDYDHDGDLDLYVTGSVAKSADGAQSGPGTLWRNNGNLTFSDVSRETATYETGWGWGSKFFDYDNDGWLDLYVMNGWVSAGKDSYVPDIFEMVTRPGICPNCRSNEAVISVSIVSGLAPGSCVVTRMVGKSTSGSAETGNAR